MSTPALARRMPLAGCTTFGIGGPARLLADARSSAELAAAVTWGREQGLDTVVLGRGSNVLVADRGFDGLVIRNARSRRVELLDGCRLRAESGVELPRLVELTAVLGLSGLEHFAGIPATLGGAVRQNLHFLSPGRDRLVFLGDLLDEATVLVDGEERKVGRDESVLRRRDAVVLDATLRLAPAAPALLRARARANTAWRRERHPLAAERRSAGCVFRNPAGASAARLIEAAGLKGRRVGGALVSRRHANFVLNAGGATAADVLGLVEVVAGEVAERFGVRLEPELELVGSADAGMIPVR